MHRKLIIQKQGKEIRKFFHLFVSLSNLSQGRQPFLIKEWISHEQKCVCVCTVGSRCVRVCMREREGERERQKREREKPFLSNKKFLWSNHFYLPQIKLVKPGKLLLSLFSIVIYRVCHGWRKQDNYFQFTFDHFWSK